MSQRCFMLYRVLTFSTGETLALPLNAFERSGDAQQARADRQRALLEMAGSGVIKFGKLAEEFSLAEFIEDLGIDGISHTVQEVTIQGPQILQPEAGIIAPGSRH